MVQTLLLLVSILATNNLELSGNILTMSRLLRLPLSLAGIIRISRSQVSFYDVFLLAHLNGALTVPELLAVADISWHSAQSLKDKLEYVFSAIASIGDLLLHIDLATITCQTDVVSVLRGCFSMSDNKPWEYISLQFPCTWGMICILFFMDGIVVLRHVKRIYGGITLPPSGLYVMQSFIGWVVLQLFVTSWGRILADLITIGVQGDEHWGFGQLVQMISLSGLSIQLWIYMTQIEENNPPRYQRWRSTGTNLPRTRALIVCSHTNCPSSFISSSVCRNVYGEQGFCNRLASLDYAIER